MSRSSSTRWCRHYQSTVDNTACKIGVPFASVRQEKGPGVPERMPCWGRWTVGCSKYSAYTPEEIKARNESLEMEPFESNESDQLTDLANEIARQNEGGRLHPDQQEGLKAFESCLSKSAKGKRETTYGIFRKVTVEEVEKDFTHADDRRWTELRTQIQEGDTIYYYSSKSWAWQSLCGRAGYMLVRGHQVIWKVVTCLN